MLPDIRRRGMLLPVAVAMWLKTSAAFAQRQQPRSGYGYDDHMMWDGWFGGFGGPLMMIFWTILLIALVVLAVRWLGGRRTSAPPPSESSLEILRQRYARGEIDQKEYEERRRILQG